MGKKGIKRNKRRKQEKMKTITILLTGYSDWFGRFIRVISRSGYSHASLSIDGTEEVFYSFNGKGVAVEEPKKRRSRRMNRPLSSRQVKKEKLRHEGLVPVSKGSQAL